MKHLKSSTSIKTGVQIALILAVLFFSLGSKGISSVVYAADPAATNDKIGDRIVINPLALPYNPGAIDTTGASKELPDEPAPGDFAGDCEGKNLATGRTTVWYEYSPGVTNTPMYLDTSGSTTIVPNPYDPTSPDPAVTTCDPLIPGACNPYEYDTYIAVFVRTNLAQPVSYSNLTMVACTDNPNNDTNQAQLAFTAEANKTYYITIAEYDGTIGGNNQYPGYDGGSLLFKMSTALTISGNVGLKGVALTYKGGATTSDSNGNYSLAIPSGFTNTVTPSMLGTVFTPATKSYYNLGSSAISQDYVGKRFNSVNKWTSSFDLSHGWTVANYVRVVGDVNGDGKSDLIGFGLDGVYVATSTGNAVNSISKWSSSLAAANGWTVKDYVRTVGDVNGDGRDDLVGFGLDGVYVALALNPGSEFGTVSKWSNSLAAANGWTVANYVRTVGDVNADGRADLVGFGLDGVYVALALNPGPGFGTVSKWSNSLAAANGWTVKDYVRTVGDVDGDGDADLIGFGLDGVYVALSNGSNAFAAPTKWITAFNLANGWTVASYVRTVGDVNGDGKADVVGFGLDGIYVAISNGTGFNPASKWSSVMAAANGWNVTDYVRILGDISGDGQADLVGFGLDGVYIAP